MKESWRWAFKDEEPDEGKKRANELECKIEWSKKKKKKRKTKKIGSGWLSPRAQWQMRRGGSESCVPTVTQCYMYTGSVYATYRLLGLIRLRGISDRPSALLSSLSSSAPSESEPDRGFPLGAPVRCRWHCYHVLWENSIFVARGGVVKRLNLSPSQQWKDPPE